MAKASVAREAACLYLRMSSKKQDKSIEAQRHELTQYAKSKGYRVVTEYADEAISGDATEKRLGFQKLIRAAETGEFSVVLCWDQDRLGRFDMMSAGYWLEPLRRNGVRLETIADGEISWDDFQGRILYSIRQEGKHQYLHDLSRNISRGKAAKLRAGVPMWSTPPFGYSKDGSTLKIVPEQAGTVREIFRTYTTQEIGSRAIAIKLNQRGVPSPHGKKWDGGAVGDILHNQAYLGHYVYGKRTRAKYSAVVGGEVVAVNGAKLKANPTIIRDAHKPIIQKKEFDRAQELLAKRQRNRGHVSVNGEKKYLLSGGILKCGLCGGVMIGTNRGGKPSYVCYSYHAGGRDACEFNLVDESAVVRAIASAIRAQVSSDKAIADLRKRMERQRKTKIRPISKSEEKQLTAEITSLDAKISRGLDTLLELPSGLQGDIHRKLAEMQQQREHAQEKLRAAQAEVAQAGKSAEIDLEAVVKAIKTLPDKLLKAPRPAARALLVGLVSEVRIEFERMTDENRRASRFKRAVIRLHGDSSNMTGSSEQRP